jgi:Na+-translocating ferredoxin:NAD+ oxidoreductase subunit B
MIAHIREAECIGCTKCLSACPYDAIIGAAKQLHTVLEAECTGCGLCLPPCPVDCIDLLSTVNPLYDPVRAQQRLEARNRRVGAAHASPISATHIDFKNEIQAAVARAKTKKQDKNP